MQLLLRHGADVDGNGLHAFGSALYQAIVSGPRCVDILLEAGANLEVRTPTGLGVLHVAVEMCDASILESLLARGAGMRRSGDVLFACPIVD